MSFYCKLLYSSTRNKLILIIDQYYFNVLRTGKLRQYFIDATQVATLALRCKIMQHSSGGTGQYWQPTQFQILLNLTKWYIQIFMVKMVVEVLITLTQKINDCRQQTMMKILAVRMENHHSTIYSAYYNYLHSLLPALINTPPPEHFH